MQSMDMTGCCPGQNTNRQSDAGDGLASGEWPAPRRALAAKLRAAEGDATRWMRCHGASILRVGLGLIFFWFGILKLFPGLSPAQGLVFETIKVVDPHQFIHVLAVWEMAIGVGLIFGVCLRATLLLFIVHMAGTALPLVVVPQLTWLRFPFALTLEGQYIAKNIVLVGAGMVIAGAMDRPGHAEDPR